MTSAGRKARINCLPIAADPRRASAIAHGRSRSRKRRRHLPRSQWMRRRPCRASVDSQVTVLALDEIEPRMLLMSINFGDSRGDHHEEGWPPARCGIRTVRFIRRLRRRSTPLQVEPGQTCALLCRAGVRRSRMVRYDRFGPSQCCHGRSRPRCDVCGSDLDGDASDPVLAPGGIFHTALSPVASAPEAAAEKRNGWPAPGEDVMAATSRPTHCATTGDDARGRGRIAEQHHDRRAPPAASSPAWSDAAQPPSDSA